MVTNKLLQFFYWWGCPLEQRIEHFSRAFTGVQKIVNDNECKQRTPTSPAKSNKNTSPLGGGEVVIMGKNAAAQEMSPGHWT